MPLIYKMAENTISDEFLSKNKIIAIDKLCQRLYYVNVNLINLLIEVAFFISIQRIIRLLSLMKGENAEASKRCLPPDAGCKQNMLVTVT